MRGAAMPAQSTFWGKSMTVNLEQRDGTETTLHLSMATVVAFSTTLIIAIISGLVIWLFALNATVQTHEAKIAVMGQIDTDHKASLEELKGDLKEIKPIIYDIRDDQKRRQR